MDVMQARKEFPMWASMPLENDRDELMRDDRRVRFHVWFERFWKKNKITVIGSLLLAVWSIGICVVTGSVVRRNTTLEVTEQLNAVFEEQIRAYQAEQARQEQASYFLSGEASFEAALNQEADAIARAIGPMKTKRMKQTMTWNILMRVDNPFYPASVQEVVDQPQQWMFYSSDNPIREDDRQIALEELRLWHDGRYPSGLSSEFVYGEWSDNDYVLRDRWEKNSSTSYWRMSE